MIFNLQEGLEEVWAIEIEEAKDRTRTWLRMKRQETTLSKKIQYCNSQEASEVAWEGVLVVELEEAWAAR